MSQQSLPFEAVSNMKRSRQVMSLVLTWSFQRKSGVTRRRTRRTVRVIGWMVASIVIEGIWWTHCLTDNPTLTWCSMWPGNNTPTLTCVWCLNKDWITELGLNILYTAVRLRSSCFYRSHPSSFPSVCPQLDSSPPGGSVRCGSGWGTDGEDGQSPTAACLSPYRGWEGDMSWSATAFSERSQIKPWRSEQHSVRQKIKTELLTPEEDVCVCRQIISSSSTLNFEVRIKEVKHIGSGA